MDWFYLDDISIGQTDDNSNSTDINGHDDSFHVFMDVAQWLIICIGFNLTLIVICALYSLIKSDHTAPVYIINLLISDLIQFCCLTASMAGGAWNIVTHIYFYAIMASVGFMVCISLERYLVIAQPLWYRFRRNIKMPLVVCGVVWILPLVYVVPVTLSVDKNVIRDIVAIFLLLPLPLFIFFLVGTLRVLSAACSVPADEKRRIVAILVVMLLIYTLLFLPTIILYLGDKSRKDHIFGNITFIFINISPLSDLTMYIFIRKGAIDKLLASLCCCKVVKSLQTNSPSV
ncbi:G-protein coupled receptor 4-like [Cololabis saira]|uniref:G-protein coupled receptor 4-like n=1 Tax=Cololabis saira TaxID=129043 RepID=UPI002AD2CD73|nr:G-protein coupled receptor 4-like [Cololabis saira]